MKKTKMNYFFCIILIVISVNQINAKNYPKQCQQPAFKGPCELDLQRWYFDVKAKDCKSFIYGGCNHNGNMFKTRILCERTCDA